MTDYLHAFAMRTKAAEVCNAQSAVFASDEYATSQPFSSESERFACEIVREKILAIPIEANHAALLAEAVKLPEITKLMALVREHCLDNHDADCKSRYFHPLPCTCGKDDLFAALLALEMP